jgi:hypothetical protein
MRTHRGTHCLAAIATVSLTFIACGGSDNSDFTTGTPGSGGAEGTAGTGGASTGGSNSTTGSGGTSATGGGVGEGGASGTGGTPAAGGSAGTSAAGGAAGTTGGGGGSGGGATDAGSRPDGPIQCERSHPILDAGGRTCGAGSCYCRNPDSCLPAATAAFCCESKPVCASNGGVAGCTSSHPLVDAGARFCAPGFCRCNNTDACFPMSQIAGCCEGPQTCF